jgi:polysaccharide export outer membrane protein
MRRHIGQPMLVSLLLALVAGYATAQNGGTAAIIDPTVHTGDVLRITAWQRPDFSGEMAVTADGTLEHPLYQTVPVAGTRLSEVRDRLRAFLGRYEADPHVAVELLLPVMVAGEVRAPSLYSLPRGTTVGQAVALAGGPTERGRLDRVRLVRGEREWSIDLMDGASSLPALPVQSGDKVFVGRRSDFNVMRNVFLPLLSLTAAVAAVVNVATR